ncbi:MAG: hypothetical protein A3H98_07585 [Bacteroidetes bacterium RIFCSPLOWO2_02_FULL_36_8]|nr:MAG: hypothetical protein A3H98_07585 [Bacteroidetes bacterium RIFCSPLOWO2_02_FULL_36_8]OFY68746.1 MAG: hypothetical protein A3G23_02830 [Bacteroidetes bacterium RIFCSPLOWO2_12_FULL_37_12]
MLKKFIPGIVLLFCSLSFSSQREKLPEENYSIQGWWRNAESSTFLLFKGNKAIEYKIIEPHILSRTSYKILKKHGNKMELKRLKVKSTSFPLSEGSCLIFDCNMENENVFICKIKWNDSDKEEIFNSRFHRISENEFEEFVGQFNNQYRNCMASNWGNPF